MPTYSLVYPVYRFPVDQNYVLLGLQKSGKWEGYFNGFGGEILPDESIHDCARRELQEEAGIIAAEGDLTLYGKIHYVHQQHAFRPSAVYVYLYEKWDGKYPRDCELMVENYLFTPSQSQIPFNKMPPNDILWLPRILNGEFVKAELTYETTHRDEFMLKSVEFENNYEQPTEF